MFPDDTLQVNLLSFSNLCNADCVITLNKTNVSISFHDELIFHGSKRANDNLLLIDLNRLQDGPLQQPPTPALANLAVKLDTDAEFIAFVHASFGSPPIATFLSAARAGWLDSYPRLTASMIASNPPISVATAKGHLDQTRQHKHRPRTTKVIIVSYPTLLLTNTPGDHLDTLDDEVYVKTVPSAALAHADSTGRFPITSRRGNQYVLVYTWRGYVHY